MLSSKSPFRLVEINLSWKLLAVERCQLGSFRTRNLSESSFINTFLSKTHPFSSDFLVSHAYPKHCSASLSGLIDSVLALFRVLAHSKLSHELSIKIRSWSKQVAYQSQIHSSRKIRKCGAFWAAQCWHIYWIVMLRPLGIRNKALRKNNEPETCEQFQQCLALRFFFHSTIYLNLHSTRAIFLCFSDDF